MKAHCGYLGDTGWCEFEIFAEDATILYGYYYADLVLDFINKDYAAILGAPLHEDEYKDAWTTFHDRFFYMKYGRGDLEYWRNMPALEEDFSALNYDFVKKIVDIVFVENEFPTLTCEQKYLAFRHSLSSSANGFLASHDYDLQYKMRVEPYPILQQKEHSKNNNKDVYAIMETLEEICDAALSNEENYKNICNTLASTKAHAMLADSSISFESLSDAVVFFLHEMIKKNCKVQICPNCNKYFVPYFRSGTVFCDRPSPQDYRKTCSEYRKYANYLTKTQTDTATKLYKQIYNIKNNKVRRCKTSDNPTGNLCVNADFERFIHEAAQWKADVKAGTRTEAEYIAWLREVKEKKVL